MRFFNEAAPETTDVVVPPGGTASTDTENDGATAEDPVETAVQSPAGGEVTITETASDPAGAPGGYELLGQTITIEAEPGTPAEPLTVTFRFDASLVDGASSLDLFRNGVLIADCDETPFDDFEDVCVASRSFVDGGDLEIVVRTVHASEWNLAVPLDLVAPTIVVTHPTPARPMTRAAP